MNDLIVKIKGGLLLTLFLLFFGSTTFFNHTHNVDGFTLVHSHPYKHADNGLPSHSHTAGGFLLIQFLATFTAITAFALAFNKLIPELTGPVSSGIVSSFRSQSFLFTPLFRGPPSR